MRSTCIGDKNLTNQNCFNITKNGTQMTLTLVETLILADKIHSNLRWNIHVICVPKVLLQ